MTVGLEQTKVIADFKDASFGGALMMDNDMRGVNLQGASVAIFDARGKKLTFAFLAGARFEKLQVDETTELYDPYGRKFDQGAAIEADGDEYKIVLASI